MNRDKDRQRALMRGIPAQVGTLDRTRQKGAAQDFVGRVLDALEAEGETPDDWEAPDLMYACGLISGGMYEAALHYTFRALTPTDERSPNQPKPAFAPDLNALRHAHHWVSSLPVLER